jgi:ribonuclease I
MNRVRTHNVRNIVLILFSREHEWSKHGTCAMDLPATANEYLYFRKALDVMKIFDATM